MPPENRELLELYRKGSNKQRQVLFVNYRIGLARDHCIHLVEPSQQFWFHLFACAEVEVTRIRPCKHALASEEFG